MKLTQKRLKECLNYDPETGVFTWLIHKRNSRCKGRVAGCLSITDGYRKIGIDRAEYWEHRLVFLYMTGKIPKICDHINRIRNDNRWCNLRAATSSENVQNRSINKNNTSGYKGVSYSKQAGKFIAMIRINGKAKSIGHFSCRHHAFCEYVLMSRKHFGEFSSV